MELRQLRYFVAVAEQLNFRQAANLLYVTQPTLSKQIADLEDELGQQLLIRNTRQVQLSDAGTSLLHSAKELIRNADKIVSDMRTFDVAESISGTLRIGIEDGYDRLTLIAAISALIQKYPGVQIEIRSFYARRGLDLLQYDQIDCAFLLFPQKFLPDNIICQVMQMDQLSLVASQELVPSQTLEAYLQLAASEGICLLSNNIKGVNLIGNIFSRWDITPEVTFLDNMTSLLLHAESEKGLAIIPRAVYEGYHSPFLTAYHILPEIASVCTVCAWNEFNDNTLRDLLLEEFPPETMICSQCSNAWCKHHG